MDENLARQAELALERHGDDDSLFFEGSWYSRGAAGRPGVAGSPPGWPGWASGPATGWWC